MLTLTEIGKRAKAASIELLGVSEKKINETLVLLAKLLKDNCDKIKAENIKDVENAKESGKNAAFIDRLTLTDSVIDGMAEGVVQVSELTSPVGKTVYKYDNEKQGIKIVEKKVPFGVVGMIYESRPNVTVDAFALAFKTHNAVILRGV